MADGQSRLLLLIEARNQAKAEVQKLNQEIRQLQTGAGASSRSLSGMGSAGQSAGRAASTGLAPVNQELLDIDNAAGIAAQGLQGLAAAAGVVGAIKLAGAAFELAQIGAESERTAAAFDNLANRAGISSQRLLDTLRTATRNTIDDTNLQLSANRALMLGVADNLEEFDQLTRIAIERGKGLGIGSQQAFNDLVTGIGRMSPLILDNLAIIVDAEQAYSDYAASVGKSVDALTEAEQKQAFVNNIIKNNADAIRDSTTATDDASTKIQQFTAAWENAKSALGEGFLAAGAAETLDTFTRAIQDSQAQIEGFVQFLRDAKEFLDLDALIAPFSGDPAAQIQGQIRSAQAMLSQLEAGRDRLVADREAGSIFFSQADLDRQNRLIAEARAELVQLRTEYARVAPESERAAQATELAGVALGGLTSSSEIAAQKQGELEAANRELNAALDASPAGFAVFAAAALAAGASVDEVLGLIRELKAEIGGIQGARDSAVRSLAGQLAGQVEKGLISQTQAQALFTEGVNQADRAAANLNTQLALAGDATDEFTFAQAQAFLAVNDGAEAIEEADRAAKRYAGTLERDAKRAASEAAREFENLKGKVAGVLSGALDPGVGVDPNEILEGLGLRENAINENARRLADIAKKGFADQEWLGDFEREVPEVFKRIVDAADPRAEAARLLRDFQDGLVPELIDKDTAKDRVRRMLLGEARMEELATEIAQELAAEFGKPVAEIESKARSALGGAATPVKVAPEIDAGALGGAFATGAAAAVRDSGVGDRMTTALEAQLKSESNLKRAASAGAEQGKAWGQGFLDTVGENVPARLIEIITNLVTPGVQAQLQLQSSLTGAR